MKNNTTALRLVGFTLLALTFTPLLNAKDFPYGKSHDYPAFQALDLNKDAQLTPEEMDKAATSLLVLDHDKDEILSPVELGGPGHFFGWLRLQHTIRVMDRDGDTALSKSELANAPAQLKRLAAKGDGDGILSKHEAYDPRETLGGGQTKADPEKGVGPMLEYIVNYPRNSKVIAPGSDPRAYEGYFLYTESGVSSDVQVNTGTFLLDPNGKKVHEWKTKRYSPEGSAAYLLDNGNLLRNVAPSDWLAIEDFSVGAHGMVEILDWDGNVLWDYQRHKKGHHVLHHDIEPLANGNILLLSYEAKTPEQVAALGGKKATGIRWFEKILEIKPNLEDGSTEVVWEWDVTDHLIQNDHPDLPNYGDPAAHPDRLDLNFIRPGERQFHFNSVDYHAGRDQLLVSSMNYNEVYVIDRQSGKIIYRWGNPAAYGMGTAADRILAGQHDARWMDDDTLPHTGDFTVHNNRAGKLPGATKPGPFAMGVTHSTILEVKLPSSDGATYPREDGKPFVGEITWQYQPNPLDSWYCPFMGGASRLPNGNTLVVNSHNKRVFEVTPKGEIVVNFHIPGPGRIFRVYKIPPTHPALKRNL
ncbi:MAG: arylsulfotransferase family protein [Verrucomicrobiaceae bacterium]